MKALLTFIGVLLLILIAISNFWLFLGICLSIWGIYEWRINRKLKAKSKVPGIIVAIGLFICLVSIGTVKPEEEAASTPSTEQTQISPQTPSEPRQEGLTATVANQTSTPKPTQNDDESESTSQDTNYISAKVVEIIDGDTVKVTINGKEETVRFLLVDTPETKAPNEPVQPFGPEATEFAEKTLAGKEVRLEFDGPERDKYDRLLAYLWIGDKIFNQMLLEEGLARVAYVYDPPYRHYDAFIAAQEKAKSEKKGIWSIPEYVTDDGFNEKVVAMKKTDNNTSTKSNKQEKQTTAKQATTKEQKSTQQKEVYYANCSAARAAGAAPIYRGEPGYRPALDRDGDGVACE